MPWNASGTLRASCNEARRSVTAAMINTGTARASTAMAIDIFVSRGNAAAVRAHRSTHPIGILPISLNPLAFVFI
jgi:hypothetical protein